jgi:hypothetical protein
MRKPSGSSPLAPTPKLTRKRSTPPIAIPDVKGIVGKVVIKALSNVRPNDWNPNEMDGFTFESLKQGLREDGWRTTSSSTASTGGRRLGRSAC